jgi:hypothetical protein
MMENSNALSDRNLEANTTLSLKREPACFAFLSSRAAAAPMPIDAINLDLASVDYFSGRASLWATLEVRSGATNDQPTAVLGFDETFLRPFTRALIEASASRHPYRMTIVRDSGETARQRVVEYITGPGSALTELVLTPHPRGRRRRDALPTAAQRLVPALLRQNDVPGRSGLARHAQRKRAAGTAPRCHLTNGRCPQSSRGDW